MPSFSDVGNDIMAFSASRARLLIHDFLVCPKLYFSPLFRSSISSLEKVIVVLFFTLG